MGGLCSTSSGQPKGSPLALPVKQDAYDSQVEEKIENASSEKEHLAEKNIDKKDEQQEKDNDWDDWDDENDEDAGEARTMKAISDTVSGSELVSICTGMEPAIGA